MKFKILIVVGKFYDGAATHLIKGSTSLLDQYKKFETTRDWGPPSILPHFPNESEDTSLRKHAIEYKILNAPGIFEIPLLISCNIEKYDAVIALGCVIKGETPHFDFISSAVTNGIMDLSIKHQKPIMNGIVTCLNEQQARERCDPSKKNKGGAATQSLLWLLGISKDQNERK